MHGYRRIQRKHTLHAYTREYVRTQFERCSGRGCTVCNLLFDIVILWDKVPNSSAAQEWFAQYVICFLIL